MLRCGWSPKIGLGPSQDEHQTRTLALLSPGEDKAPTAPGTKERTQPLRFVRRGSGREDGQVWSKGLGLGICGLPWRHYCNLQDAIGFVIAIEMEAARSNQTLVLI